MSGHFAIDSHLHVWEEDRTDRPRSYAKPWSWAPDPHPISDALSTLDASGVSAALQVTPRLMGFDNEYSFEVGEQFPNRISVLARFDPAAPGPTDGLSALRERRGFAGIRLTFYRDGTDPRFLDPDAASEFWRAIADFDIVVSVYAPNDLPAMLRVLERYPQMRVVIDHMGVAVHEGADGKFDGMKFLGPLAKFDNVFFKLSGICEVSASAYPYSDVCELIAHSLGELGPERFIWGSDYPNVLKKCSYGESLTYLSDAGVLNARARQLVMVENALRLFGDSLNPLPLAGRDEREEARSRGDADA